MSATTTNNFIFPLFPNSTPNPLFPMSGFAAHMTPTGDAGISSSSSGSGRPSGGSSKYANAISKIPCKYEANGNKCEFISSCGFLHGVQAKGSDGGRAVKVKEYLDQQQPQRGNVDHDYTSFKTEGRDDRDQDHQDRRRDDRRDQRSAPNGGSSYPNYPPPSFPPPHFGMPYGYPPPPPPPPFPFSYPYPPQAYAPRGRDGRDYPRDPRDYPRDPRDYQRDDRDRRDPRDYQRDDRGYQGRDDRDRRPAVSGGCITCGGRKRHDRKQCNTCFYADDNPLNSRNHRSGGFGGSGALGSAGGYRGPPTVSTIKCKEDKCPNFPNLPHTYCRTHSANEREERQQHRDAHQRERQLLRDDDDERGRPSSSSSSSSGRRASEVRESREVRRDREERGASSSRKRDDRDDRRDPRRDDDDHDRERDHSHNGRYDPNSYSTHRDEPSEPPVEPGQKKPVPTTTFTNTYKPSESFPSVSSSSASSSSSSVSTSSAPSTSSGQNVSSFTPLKESKIDSTSDAPPSAVVVVIGEGPEEEGETDPAKEEREREDIRSLYDDAAGSGSGVIDA